MKSAGNESESRDDPIPGQFFFVSTQALAGLEKDEGFEEPSAVGKVTLHSLDYWVIDSGATYSMTPRADLLTELEPSPVKHVTSALGQRAEVKGMGKAMFKGADGKMVGLKNVLWVPNLAANLISVRRLQKAGMDASSKGAKTYTARLGERLLWDLHEERDVYNEMWQISVVPMPKERQVAASISTKGEAVGSGDGANGRAKEMKSKKCNLGGTSKLGEHEESGAAAQKQHKGEENPRAAAEEEYGENMWGTIASAAFSNPTSATGECDWLTLHRRMGHVALPILQQLVKNEMVAGIRVKGEPDEPSRDCKFMENLMYKDWKAENEAKIGMRFGEVKSSGLEHVELPLEMSSGSTTTRQSSLVNGGEEAKDAEEEEEEVQQKAMESDLKSIEENGTWELVELPEGRKSITSKWLFKIKSDADGKIERYKSRLVAMGYQQKEKVDFKELFAHVVKLTKLRTLLAGAAIKGWPERFDDGSGRVWKLKKALYGLKQAPRKCYLKLREVLEEIGFTPSYADHSLFILGEGEQRSFIVVYVDDILIFSPSSDLLKEVMLKLQDKYGKRCMRVHQRKHLEALAGKFGQSEGHVATPFPSGFKCVKGPEEESVGEEERHRFHSLVGSLMYAAVNTRPDAAFATGQLARVVQCPNEEQVAAGMRVASCLGQTPTVGLQYSAAAQRRQKGADGVEPGRLFLTAFSDASYASEREDMTSVGGFICCVGGGPTAWESKKQVDQALSSVESEYMALFRCHYDILVGMELLYRVGATICTWQEKVLYRVQYWDPESSVGMIPVKFVRQEPREAYQAQKKDLSGELNDWSWEKYAQEYEGRTERRVKGEDPPSLKERISRVWALESALCVLELCVLELYGGIGSGLAAALKAGGFIRKWVHVEKDPVVRRMARHHALKLLEDYPQQMLSTAIPAEEEATVDDVRDITEEQLEKWGQVDLVVAGWECQGYSRAGEGRGMEDPRGASFRDPQKVLEMIQRKQGEVLYILENVDLAEDKRELVKLAFAKIEAAVGRGVAADAAQLGSRAHRPKKILARWGIRSLSETLTCTDAEAGAEVGERHSGAQQIAGTSEGPGSPLTRVMDAVRRNVPLAACYIDDVIVFSPSPKQHVNDVQATLEAIREARLTCHPKKCEFGGSLVKYFGFEVQGGRMSIQQAKVEVLNRVPAPKDKTTLRAVLGFLNYYRKFVPNFSRMAAALNQLLREDQAWQWGEAEQGALEALLNMVKTASVLTLPSKEDPFVLYTDWSSAGMGAILCQEREGQEMVVAFASRSCNPAEANYCSYEGGLAVVWGVTTSAYTCRAGPSPW
ncbi:unnamed protein product [Closterium sp. NIES-54]